MAATEIVRMSAKTGQGDDLQRTLENIVYLLTDHPENLGVTILRQIEDPDVFTLNVKWTSKEAHESWVASDSRTTWRDALAPYRSEQPPDMAHYTVVVQKD